jgi:large subunit ribosomal protein L25
LAGTLREGVFTRPELRELRKKGLVPGRIQTGKGPKGAIYVAMELASLRRAAQYRTLHNRLWKVCLPDREPLTCLIREMQTHHINDEDIIHVNFVHYVPGVPRMVEVPIEVLNLERSPGVKRGGSFSLVMPTVRPPHADPRPAGQQRAHARR